MKSLNEFNQSMNSEISKSLDLWLNGKIVLGHSGNSIKRESPLGRTIELIFANTSGNKKCSGLSPQSHIGEMARKVGMEVKIRLN
jgi:hypothetical protein